MTLLSIGEFARLSRLSAKARRRYDELGLLRPERVDPDSGYRWYAAGPLEQARMVAALRQIGTGDPGPPGHPSFRAERWPPPCPARPGP